MPGKMVQCTSCSKTMRSDNLRRHARSCKNINSHNSHRLPGYGVGNHVETRRLTDTSIADEDDTSSGDESAKDSVDGEDLICPDTSSIGLWERLAILCFNHGNNLPPFDIFKACFTIHAE